MKYSQLFILIFGLTFFGSNLRSECNPSIDFKTIKTKSNVKSKDKDEIQKLIRQVLNWANSDNAIDLLPVISDSSDSIYVGFDSKVLNMNLKKMSETNLFAKE